MSKGHESEPTFEIDNVPWTPVSDVSIDSCDTSSTISWTDETDNSTTRELEEQFQKFEEVLYLEANPDELPKSLQEEVKIWLEYSPHIRIRGIQAKLNERLNTNEEVEDPFDVQYEEIIAFHESLDSSDNEQSSCLPNRNQIKSSTEPRVISKNFKNEEVNGLFDKELQVEPCIKSLSAGIKKEFSNKESGKILKNLETIKSHRVLSRSNSSRSYLRGTSPQKRNIDCGCVYSSALSSRGVRLHHDSYSNGLLTFRDSYGASHTNQPKNKNNKISKFSNELPANSYLNRTKPKLFNDTKKTKSQLSDKSIILPPIEALAISPQKPDKRINSAMVRFTKTLPRVCSNTSKKKKVNVKSLNSGYKEKEDKNKGFSNRVEESSDFITLEVIGVKTKAADRANRLH